MSEILVPFQKEKILENANFILSNILLNSQFSGKFEINLVSSPKNKRKDKKTNNLLKINLKSIAKIFFLNQSQKAFLSLSQIKLYSHKLPKHFLVNDLEGEPILMNYEVFLNFKEKNEMLKSSKAKEYVVFNDLNRISNIEQDTLNIAFSKPERHMIKLFDINNQPVIIVEKKFIDYLHKNQKEEELKKISLGVYEFEDYKGKIVLVPKENVFSKNDTLVKKDDSNGEDLLRMPHSKSKKFYCVNFRLVKRFRKEKHKQE